MSATFVRTALALATALLLGVPLGAAPVSASPAPLGTATLGATDVSTTVTSARAGSCRPRCWTAIAFNPETLRSGWTQNGAYGSKLRAMKSAFNHCRTRPVNAGHARACVWPGRRNVFRMDGCVAVAWRVRNDRLVEWGKGKAFTKSPAMRRAKRVVEGRGTIDAGYACSPRSRL